ncbi:DUF1906 domain-containing protein [Streptomyces sp. DSM 44917]|uniref:DUF1906 domain-containing protein n=1 Tax=Streptomyces boetiae TaxID=3075541 RepID=A0ABU2LDK3_9ACTN|nr:DUF1906 domain-containing protein [Streptomyces sp. DSM 44917]MDT0309263.1 DUF1906 domain-containing protein [Streptomyces sp. DSM 44917]
MPNPSRPRASRARRPARTPRRPARALFAALPALLAALGLATPPAAADPAPDAAARAATPLMDEDLTPLGAEIYQGRAFDTCEAPSLTAMRDWLASPYRGVGVYIGGHGRACPEQANLTPAWARDVTALGWHLLPLYVGSQSPCVRNRDKSAVPIDASRPRRQGEEEAKDALDAARALGMTAGSPVYLDIEDYDHTDQRCAATTLAFVQGFSRAVREAGWIPGVYSSAGSGITHLESARRAGTPDLPDVLWYARWNGTVSPGVDSLNDEPSLDPAAWQPHRRIHQYAGDVRETHGGRTISIDRNLVHAPVAVLAPAAEDDDGPAEDDDRSSEG